MTAESKFNSGVEDSRTPDQMMTLVKAKLDLFEVLQSVGYVLTKFLEDGSGKYDSEAGEADAELDGNEKSSMDITLNLDNDYFRVLKIDLAKDCYKYSVISQIDFDNIVWDYTTTTGTAPEYEDLIEKLRQFGNGKFKSIGESKYLLNGGKNQEDPEFDRSMLKK